MNLLTKALLAIATTAVFAATAQAAPIFFEDFEGGPAFNSTRWVANSSGAIVADATLAGNEALKFNALRGGGDLFSSKSMAAGTYYLNIDMRGTCATGNCGGFVGIEDAVGEQWLIGDTSYSAVAHQVLTTGTWTHFEFAFTARSGGNFQLKLEDFSGVAGDVFFDNVCVSSTAGDSACLRNTGGNVPEPGSLALVGLALAGLGWTARRRQG